MKKIISFTFLLGISLLLFSFDSVEAKQCTGYKAAPYMYEVSPQTNTSVYKLKTAANVCKGSNTEVYFRGFRAAPASFPTDEITVHIYLKEDDPDGNQDENVKRYQGVGRNRTISTISYWVLNDGNIDSQGDQTCELYLQMCTSGYCCNREVRASLFDYQICMN